jgi:hypothetical protein
MSAILEWMFGWGDGVQQQGPQLDLFSDGPTSLGTSGAIDLISDGHTALSTAGAVDLISDTVG